MSADLVELLHTRRSVREFHDRPIPLGLLEEVLEAALWAPSADNGQS
ncbi:MAG: nitroreductase family protein [Deltaproteobacteria bacterium]|nr:nitroreductase family protein [Deltaproteobacteria bacterium]